MPSRGQRRRTLSTQTAPCDDGDASKASPSVAGSGRLGCSRLTPQRLGPEPGRLHALLSLRHSQSRNTFGDRGRVGRRVVTMHEKISELYQRLAPLPGRRAEIVSVVGPSGSGKSSLVNAGLLPRLAGFVINGSCSRRWSTARSRSPILRTVLRSRFRRTTDRLSIAKRKYPLVAR